MQLQYYIYIYIYIVKAESRRGKQNVTQEIQQPVRVVCVCGLLKECEAEREGKPCGRGRAGGDALNNTSILPVGDYSNPAKGSFLIEITAARGSNMERILLFVDQWRDGHQLSLSFFLNFSLFCT